MKNRITIAGGGLAGLSLGIALRLRGVNVTLHEASVYPRHRVCGEFLSGITDEALDHLGITEALQEAIPLRSASWSNGRKTLGEMGVEGRGISRWKLDDLLQRRFVALGGNLVTRSRIESARGVIWAAGRPKSQSDWIGLKIHVRDFQLTHDLEMVLGSRGYLGMAKVERGLVNVCGLFKKQPLSGVRGHRLLFAYLQASGLGDLSERLEAASVVEESFSGVAGFRFGSSGSAPFSLGDACCIIPPFTGNGMSMALESADCALEPALDFARGSLSWEEAARASSLHLGNRFRKRMMVASLLHPLLTSSTGLGVVRALGAAGLLPYKTFYRLLR